MRIKFLCLLALICFLFCQNVHAQLQESALKQIQSLIDEKESRTPAQKKISSQLIYASKMDAGLRITPEVATLETGITKDAEGKVKVELDANVTNSLITQLETEFRCRILFSSEKFGNILALVPLANIERIAGLDAVHHIIEWIAPMNNSVTGRMDNFKTATADDFNYVTIQNKPHPATVDYFRKTDLTGRLQNVRNFLTGALHKPGLPENKYFAGAVVSEADATHRAALARTVFGTDGTGVKIGVISNGVDFLATSQAAGELPAVTVLPGQAGTGNEGTAMLELIHDLAPGAQLYFATALSTQANFAQNILDLRTAGCDIIVDDVTYFKEGVFQDDDIARSVNTVTASGALYFSSAGNSGNKNDNTSGVWEGDFLSGGASTAPIPLTGDLHDFGGSLFNIQTLVGSRLTLKWSDPLLLSGNDYDLFRTNSLGTVVTASSTNVQDGNDDPYEFVNGGNAGERVYILRKTGAAIRALDLNTNRGTLSINTSGVTYGHNAGNNTICVAATPASLQFTTGYPVGPYPGYFNSSNTVELFSSDGLRKIFFNPDGTEITPGNLLFGTNGGNTLQKPDLTAADGTVTSTSGFLRFFGTSAAAPHAAAIAALVKSKLPALTAAQVKAALVNSAIDIETPGVDRDAGAGIIMATSALVAAGATAPAYLVRSTVTAVEGSFSNSNGFIEPGEIGSMTVLLENAGTTSATTVVGVLSTTTPGVTITQNTGTYNTISGLSSGVNTGSPYIFGINSSVPCGTVINFTLTVTYLGGGVAISPQTFNFSVTAAGPAVPTISGVIGSAAPTGTGFTSTSGSQTGRVNRDGVIPTCASPKASVVLNTATGSRAYHAYTFNNTSTISQCVTVSINTTTPTKIYQVVYNNNGFIPASTTSNYLADQGTTTNVSPFSFTAPPGQQFTVVVHEVDPAGATGQAYNLNVDFRTCTAAPSCPVIDISPTSLPNGSVGSGYNQTISASGGNGNYAYTLSGALPTGLTFSSTGVLSGTPNQTGDFPITVIATDVTGCAGTHSYNIHIDCPTIVADPVSNKYFCNGSTASVSFTGTNATEYTWTNNNPAIGLSANGTGNLNFTANNNTAAPISATIVVTPVSGVCSGAPITFTITILNEPAINNVVNGEVCEPGGVVNLSVSGNGTINWFSAATNGTPLNVGNNYSPNINTTTTFYVESAVSVSPPTTLTMPGQSNTFPGNTRGYWFTAPVDFTITALRVPTTASSGPQNMAIVKFNGNIPPPVFSASTNAFVTLALINQNPAIGKIPVNVQVHAGEVIGILGSRGGINTYAPGDYATSIFGFPVQLERLGMQFPLETTNPRDLWREFGATTSISRVEFDYTETVCVTSPRTPVTATIVQKPNVTATPSSQTICSGSAISTIVLGSSVTGTTFTWTRDNTGNVTGISDNGNGDISGSLTNTTAAPVTVTFTITPTKNYGNGVICTGATTTATVVVNPTPNASALPKSQTICSGSPITTIVLSGNVIGTTFNWSRDNIVSVTGIAESGSGDISGTLVNTTSSPITVTFTITPTYTNAGKTCTGPTEIATVLVNPCCPTIPNVNVSPIVECFGSLINFSSTGLTNMANGPYGIAYKVFNGTTADPYSGGTLIGTVPFAGLTTGGSAASLGSNLVPAGNWTVYAVLSPTPTDPSCRPFASTTLTINPIPNAIATPNSQTICSGDVANIIFTGNVNGTVYNWTRDKNAEITGIASTGSGNISGTLTNTTNAPVTVTFTITPSYTNGGVTCTGMPITATVIVKPTSAISITGEGTYCGGSTATLTATAGFNSYSWSLFPTNAILGTSQTLSVSKSSSVAVTGINAFGCPSSADVTVQIGDYVFTGGLNAGNSTTSNRLFLNGVVSTCAATKPCQVSAAAGPFAYNLYSVTNPNPNPVCANVSVSNVLCNEFLATSVYLGSFNPANICANLIADNGNGVLGGTIPLEVIIPGGATIIIRVSNTTSGSYCTNYQVVVDIPRVPAAITTTPDVNICSGSPATLTASLANSYSWSPGGATTSSITVSPLLNTTYTVTLGYGNSGCTSTASQLITVKPIPDAQANVNTQTICSGSSIQPVTFTGTVPGTVYSWTRDNIINAPGIAPNGTGSISGTLNNFTNTPQTATFTITPSANGCTGTPITVTFIVNPTPNVTASVSSQTICSGSPITSINLLSNVVGTTFSWIRNTAALTGMPMNGSGNSIAGTLINNGISPVTEIFTITPSYTNAGKTCTGTPITVTVTVNPLPDVTTNIQTQTICSGDAISLIHPSGTVNGTIFSWSRDNASVIPLLPSSGIGDITGVLTNITNLPQTVTYTITPSYTNAGTTCTGTTVTSTVVVNPVPNGATNVPVQSSCSGSPISIINLLSNVPGTTFSWTRDQASVTGIPMNGSGNSITGILTNSGAFAVTVTFTITPTYTNAGKSCNGQPFTSTVTVNPVTSGVINGAAIANICAGQNGSVATTLNGVSTFNGVFRITNTNTNAQTQHSWNIFGGSGNMTLSIPAALLPNTGGTSVNYLIEWVSLSDASGCTAQLSGNATITVNPGSTVTVNAPATVCPGSNIVIGVTGSGGPGTFSWNATAANGAPLLNSSGVLVPFSNNAINTNLGLTCSNLNGINPVTFNIIPQGGFGCFNQPVSVQVNIIDVTPPQLNGTLPGGPVGNLCMSQFNVPPTANIQSLFTDNCSAVLHTTVSVVTTGTDCSWTKIATYNIADACNNTTTVNITFTGGDSSGPAPTILAGSLNRTVEYCDQAGLAAAQALVPSFADCSTGSPITVVKQPGTFVPGNCATAGTIVNLFIATDACGNTSSFTQGIIITDNTGPVISGIQNQTLSIGGGCSGLLPDYITSTGISATDCNPPNNLLPPTPLIVYNNNLSGNLRIWQSPAPGTSITGSSQVTISAMDACGNLTTQTFTVTVVAGALPQFTTCPQNMSVSTAAPNGLSGCRANVALPLPVYISNCTTTLQWTISGATPPATINGSFPSSYIMNEGISTLTYRLTDANGNSTTCSFTVTVTNTLNATISGTTNAVQNVSTSTPVTFTGINGTPIYTFTYDVSVNAGPFGAPQSVSSATGQSSAVIQQSNAVTGIYTYRLLSVMDANGCIKSLASPITAVITVIPTGTGTPDLTSSQFFSSTQIPAGGFIDLAVIVRNVGSAPTSGPIVINFTNYNPLTGLTLTQVLGNTTMVIGIDTYITSPGWTINPGAGTITSNNVIAPGGSNIIGLRITRGTGANAGANGAVTFTITIPAGTGGGESPSANNTISNSILKN